MRRARRDHAGTALALPPQRRPVLMDPRRLRIAEDVVEAAQKRAKTVRRHMEHMFERVERASDGTNSRVGGGWRCEVVPGLERSQAAEPSDDQTSIFVRIRSTTAVVNSVVPLDPPRSGVLIPEPTVSSAAS